MNPLHSVVKQILHFFIAMSLAAMCLRSADIFLDNQLIEPHPPAGTIVGNLSFDGDASATFQFSNTGDFLNPGEFDIPFQIDCTGSTSDTGGGVSSTGGVSATDGNCVTTYTLQNSLFFLEGNQMKTTGSLSFSDLTTFYIGVKGASELGSVQKFISVSLISSNPLEASSDLGDGWKESDWFGVYYQSQDSEWIYHSNLGWLFIDTSRSGSGVYFWQEELGWSWTQMETFPVFFSFGLSSWIYFSSEEPNTPFYNFTSEDWFGI